MPIPLDWKLCLVVFVFSAAGAVVGMWLHEDMSAPRLHLGRESRPDSLSGKNFQVIETIPPFEWKS